VDNGSSHRGKKAADRLRERWPKLVLVHVPVHASWLNQVWVNRPWEARLAVAV
jgi:hypothetical protein